MSHDKPDTATVSISVHITGIPCDSVSSAMEEVRSSVIETIKLSHICEEIRKLVERIAPTNVTVTFVAY